MRWKAFFPALIAGAAFAGSADAQNYGVGTSPQGTITYSAGAAIAKVASTVAGVELRVQPHGGTTVAVPLINTGELDFGLANVLETLYAVEGTAIFEGKPNPKLRAVSVIFPLRVGFFVRANSDIRSIADLKGRSLPVSYTSQAIIRVLLDAMLASAGLTTDDVEGVPVPNIVRGADDFATGKVDAFFFAVGAGKVSQVSAKTGGIRLLPFPDTPEAIAAARKFVPPAYLGTIKPSKRMVGVVAPSKILAYDYLFLAGEHVPDDVVYKVTAALHGNRDALISAFGIFRGFQPAKMAKKLDVDYHAGAVKFYTEAGLWPPK